MKRLLVFALLILLSLSFASAQTNTTHAKIIGVYETNGSEYRGVMADLYVETQPGTGRVFVDTMPLTQIDTQASARLAREVACEIMGIDCSKIDVFYIIRADYPIIGGPSAGAAMTAATMAAFQGVPINSDVSITGTINPAGSIGPVGTILEKAQAANEFGINILLIPKGQEYAQIMDEAVSVIEKARKDWGLRVVEVSNVLEAYTYLTGYKIEEIKVSSADVASEKYDEAMNILSEGLIKQADDKLDEVKAELKESKISEANKNDIENLLDQAENQLEKANEYFSGVQYYSSASFCVRSLLYSYTAENSIDYYSEGEKFVEEKTSQVAKEIQSFEILFLKETKIDSKDDIEVFAVVIDRIREAEDILEESKAAWLEKDLETTLNLIAYAEVKKNTAYEWLTIVNIFTGGEVTTFEPANVRTIARERIELSRTYIVYAETVADNNILDSARKHLSKAESAFEDQKYVFALFEAAKSRAEATLSMEARAVTNLTVGEKIKQLESDAAFSIKTAEEQGLLPILALSYLEFGKTFEEVDPVQSLIYFSYSKEMAKISQDLAMSAYEYVKPSTEISKYYEYVIKIDYKQQIFVEMMVMITGIAAGILIAFVLLERVERKRRII